MTFIIKATRRFSERLHVQNGSDERQVVRCSAFGR